MIEHVRPMRRIDRSRVRLRRWNRCESMANVDRLIAVAHREVDSRMARVAGPGARPDRRGRAPGRCRDRLRRDAGPAGSQGLRCRDRRPDRRRADAALAGAGCPAGRGAAGRRDPGRRARGSTSTCPTAGCSTRSRRGSRWPRCSAGYKPKVVIGFGGKTVLASPDHYQAMLITDAAVFYSRLTKWDEYFDGLPTHTIANQLSFPIGLAWVGLAGGIRLHCCRHRLDPGDQARGDPGLPDPVSGQQGWDLPWRRGHEPYHGLTAGFEAGEVFMTYRSVGVDDLMRWASPAHART